MASSPQSPASAPRLPLAVEALLAHVRREQTLPPPDLPAVRALAALGEDVALRILTDIASCRVRNLSAFILHMARLAEPPATQHSACFSDPSVTSPAAVQEDYNHRSPRLELPPPPPAPAPVLLRQAGAVSEQMVALGELEFRKAFLILSYIGRNKLEDAISVDKIRKLRDMPMDLFEREVWSRIGCISELDRRKNLEWDSGKTHVYHCHVDLDGACTFKGPYLQPTRTHLQRVLGDDNVLLVKFDEDSGRNRFNQGFDRLNSIYDKIGKEGILVGLRRYRFFVFKDGGKEEKKKSPSSSPVKCYFVRTESCWSVDEDRSYILDNKSIFEARSIFMHAHTVSSLSKYMARFSLILSKSIPLDINLSSVKIERVDDIPCMDEDGNIVYNEDGEPMIHTDGTGFISEDLALKCPGNIFKGRVLMPRDMQEILNGPNILNNPSSSRQCKPLIDVPPLLIQFRLFYNGCAAKGTLLVDQRLPPNTIHLRPSMIKVEADKTISNIQSCNSLEVVGTSNQPKRTYLSRYLIALLHYGGVPKEYFLGLVSSALDDAQNARYSKQAALRVALKYVDMNDCLEARMILCGIPLNEPYLQSRLSILMREERKGLKGGRLPVDECYYLMGTSDPTGTLKPNEVCIILNNGHVSGNVLVFKHPGLHFGDIHILTATYNKELDSIVGNAKYAIFFPTKGPRSLADEMANSDFDGDIYWVSRNPQLLHYFKASKPWERTSSSEKIPQPKPTEFSNSELEKELFQQFLNTRFKPSYAISTAADSWMAFMDRLMTLGDDSAEEKQCLQEKLYPLINIYYDALDAPKTGLKVDVPTDLKAEMFPHYMEKSNSYHSTSILGLIYDKVDSFQIDNVPSREEVWKLPCFSREVPQSCLKLWEERYRDYLNEMRPVMLMDQETKNILASEIIHKYKSLLYGAAVFEESPRKREEIFDEALAIYQVSYSYAERVKDCGRCSFAWNIAGAALCMLHAMKQEGSLIVCLPSILRELLDGKN